MTDRTKYNCFHCHLPFRVQTLTLYTQKYEDMDACEKANFDEVEFTLIHEVIGDIIPTLISILYRWKGHTARSVTAMTVNRLRPLATRTVGRLGRVHRTDVKDGPDDGDAAA